MAALGQKQKFKLTHYLVLTLEHNMNYVPCPF